MYSFRRVTRFSSTVSIVPGKCTTQNSVHFETTAVGIQLSNISGYYVVVNPVHVSLIVFYLIMDAHTQPCNIMQVVLYNCSWSSLSYV